MASAPLTVSVFTDLVLSAFLLLDTCENFNKVKDSVVVRKMEATWNVKIIRSGRKDLVSWSFSRWAYHVDWNREWCKMTLLSPFYAMPQEGMMDMDEGLRKKYCLNLKNDMPPRDK
ncbi:hypothetical protein Tco_0992857 [Tanacetum coccineum]|uniref:Uncharacterized protein n=1 Tax=Tanacetum coccineum TaxID=301880 RepID=A0ABQ5F414_9ASTR